MHYTFRKKHSNGNYLCTGDKYTSFIELIHIVE